MLHDVVETSIRKVERLGVLKAPLIRRILMGRGSLVDVRDDDARIPECFQHGLVTRPASNHQNARGPVGDAIREYPIVKA